MTKETETASFSAHSRTGASYPLLKSKNYTENILGKNLATDAQRFTTIELEIESAHDAC